MYKRQITVDARWFLGDRDARRGKRPGNDVIQGVMMIIIIIILRYSSGQTDAQIG